MGRRKSKINIHNFSTRRQTKSSDLVDRISLLPDSILSVILSFLHTKEAVATSILSRRWKFAWQTVRNLDFYYDGSKAEKEDEAMNFFEFVNRVFHGVGLLSNFRLVCRKPIYVSSSRVGSWISTAISKKVHELSLILSGKFDIPTSVFTYDSLQSLEFTSTIISVSDSAVICLPRLHSLKLDSVYFESEQAFENLINGCPLLNFLHLHISNKDFKCIISSVSLRHLEIHFEYESSLKLKASSLEYLRLIGDISEIFVEERLSSLVEADFGFFLRHKFRNNSIVEAVRTLDCAKVLTLSATVMQALSRATISLSTEFKRLVKLVVGNRGPLQDLIHSSDNLQVLIINRDPDDPYDDDIKRSTFVEVPRFLSNSLKKVQIDGYTGSKVIREMIRLMLKHGSVLEVMEIFNDEDEYETYESVFEERFQLLQKICEFPRKSPACEVRFLSCDDSPHGS